ncbi:MAG: AtpZ/AtpI family protein [Lachnospiraceae bacterium]|nr:AtpZ/AtpI family protein [Lachnospiraceae bacterium]
MSRGRKKKYDKSVYRSLALITQFGINMLVPIGMLTALGIWLDGKFDTSYWTVLLFFVGAVAGGQNVYRMAKAVYAPDGKQERDIAHEDAKPTHTDIEK